MAAAYAALVSRTQTIDHILHPPPDHQFNFDRDQISCLRKKADFLIDYFLENHSNTGGDQKEIEHLETRIRVAAEGAEASSSSRPLPIGENIMVGFDGHVNEIMGDLSTDESNRQIMVEEFEN